MSIEQYLDFPITLVTSIRLQVLHWSTGLLNNN